VADSLVRVTHSRYDAQGRCLEALCAEHPARDFPGLWLEWENVNDFEALLVATDGAQSFEGTALYQSVQELLAVKNPTGLFLHRRMGAMARSWKKGTARMPQDDLGAAALWFLPLDNESTLP